MLIFQTLKFILNHPLNRDDKVSALKRYFGWQIASRLVWGTMAVPFVNNSKLLVSAGMTGATGNIYCGLHEFEDMAFVLHLLRTEDLFVDVGANVGSYTVLAGAAVGAQCISFEPLPAAYHHLQNNIILNDMQERARAYNIGISGERGVLRFTVGLDAVNHVASSAETGRDATLEVRVSSLDEVVGDAAPKLIKIDAEGFETNVIAGAGKVLSNDNLDAIIMELNGSGKRYGFDDAVLHQRMLDYGFNAFCYAPFDRALTPLAGKKQESENTLYVRNVARVKDRLATALKFHVLQHDI